MLLLDLKTKQWDVPQEPSIVGGDKSEGERVRGARIGWGEERRGEIVGDRKRKIKFLSLARK